MARHARHTLSSSSPPVLSSRAGALARLRGCSSLCAVGPDCAGRCCSSLRGELWVLKDFRCGH